MNDDNSIIGVWHLISFEVTSTNGVKAYPMGKKPLGRLIYTPDGYMSANLSKDFRRNFKSELAKDATIFEWGVAAVDYISYTGKYYLEGNVIAHEVDMGLFPNDVGTKLLRNFECSNNNLHLSFSIETDDPQVSYDAKLVWAKA